MRIFFILISFINLGIGICSCTFEKSNERFIFFLSKFRSVDLPIIPSDYLVNRAGLESDYRMSFKEFEEFLKGVNDTTWNDGSKYEYIFGGKYSFNDIWILFYGRYFFSEDIEDQIGEIVLVSFNENGNLISALPIGGGYGDDVVVHSKIVSKNLAILKEIRYSKDVEIVKMDSLIIDRNGNFLLKVYSKSNKK